MSGTEPAGGVEHLLGPTDLEHARRVASERGIPLDLAAIALGLLTEDQMLFLSAERSGVELVFPEEDGIDRELLRSFPPELLRRHGALPLVRDEDEAVVAFAEIPSAATIDEISASAGEKIRPVLASARRLTRLLDQVVGGGAVDATRVSAEDSSGMAAFYRHLAAAFGGGARELRFEPGGDGVRVRYRNGEELVEAGKESSAFATGIAIRARMLAGLPLDSRGLLQSTFEARVAGRDERLKAVIAPTPHGDAIALFAEQETHLPADLAGWDLPEKVRRWLEGPFSAPAGRSEKGLVLVVAPTSEAVLGFAAHLLGVVDPGNAVALAGGGKSLERTGRIRVALGTEDRAAEVRALRALRPDVLFVFGGDTADAARDSVTAALEGIRVVYGLVDPVPGEASVIPTHWGDPPRRARRALAAIVALKVSGDGYDGSGSRIVAKGEAN